MRWSAACTSAALAISSERGTLSVIYRSYGVSGPDDGADAVAEGLEPVERVVDGVDRAGTERARELYRGNAEAAGAEDGDRLAGREARLAQRMQCGRRGAHHDGALLIGDGVRQAMSIPRRHADELRE